MARRLPEDIGELVPRQDCEFEENDGFVTVLYVEKEPTFIERTFFKHFIKKPHRVDLDEVGSVIWKMIDGKSSVDELTKKAEEHFGDKIAPADERVKLFINQMFYTKLIKLFRKTD
jgi:hypothetical protein